ncbi:hypothetical protein CANARDRAFT_202052 [[Candida] arabinofermentans NRRL YB-2248]|uniref:RRM domain-containing protein n=1 Tax=[Candida] arabinofermentans NRRL YB-2248 TaxID=983967 RepID=A0A1E4SWJ7_9ASCO|nr:hypothetical protein CANARDRAFT_202052 [[Candida] arabinofermentans NRRL YB-2248]
MSLNDSTLHATSKDCTLYLGNLDPQVTELLLYELFIQFAPVKSVRLPKDRLLRKHQGFGFVEFNDIKDAEYCLNLLNGLKIYNNPLRIRKLQANSGPGDDPSSGFADELGPVLYVGNLDKLVDTETLTETFLNFGQLRRQPKIVFSDTKDHNHAFIYYQDFQSSDTAIKEMRGKMILNEPIKIDYAYKKDSKEKHDDASKQEVVTFINQETSKAKVQNSVTQFTDMCFKKCITNIDGNQLSNNEATCATDCLNRFLDTNIKIVQINGEDEKIGTIIKQLRNDYAYAVHQPNARYGGLIGLAAVAIALGQNEVPKYLESIMHPVLACFGDQDSMVRYFACEALYNIAKVSKGEILIYFNEIFDVLCKLVADVDISVKNAADILDRLIKDITSEKAANYVSILAKPVEPSSSKIMDQRGKTLQIYEPQIPKAFSLPKFIPLLKERMYATNPYTRMFLVSWLRLLDSIPGLELISYLPSFLDALISYLSASLEDVRVVTENFLKLLLHEIKRVSEIKKLVKKEKEDKEAQETIDASNADNGVITMLDHEQDLYIPGQDIVIDYHKIIDILITSLDSPEELIQLVSLQWLITMLQISPESFILFMPKLLSVLLTAISHANPQLRDIAMELNSKLMELASTDQHDINYTLIVNQLTLQFLNEKESTRLTALDWLIMLHEKNPLKFLEHSDNTFVTLLKALNDPSDKVINKDLELLSKLSNQSDDKYFQSFMTDLLNLFKKERKLLDTRADFIIRTICKSLNPERVYKSISKVLSEEETNMTFLSIMIQILNNNLIIAPEMADLRKKLIKGEDPELFETLFKCWSFNSPSVLCLTLLTSYYNLSYKIVLNMANFEISLNLLIQLDLLIQLFESPVFAKIRLDLLNPKKNGDLYKCLYGLLMLLPQSNSFKVLQNRLSSITPIIHLQLDENNDDEYEDDEEGITREQNGSGNGNVGVDTGFLSNFNSQIKLKNSSLDLDGAPIETSSALTTPKKSLDYITKFSGRLSKK